MSPLMENFIQESRDLIEASTRSLLELEARPNDKEVINELFRGIHTVKGASGVIDDIESFTSLAHTMEDLLQKVRDGQITLDSVQIDALLGCCDQLLLWIDELEANEILGDDAARLSLDFVKQIEGFLIGDKSHTEEEAPQDASGDKVDLKWLASKLGQDSIDEVESLEQFSNHNLIIYTPNPNCFFSGDDPLAWMQSVPDVVWKKVVLTQSTDPFDPYQAQLVFYVLSAASREEIISKFIPIEDQYKLMQLETTTPEETDIDERIEFVNKIVDSQVNLIRYEHTDERIRSGAIASARRVYRALAKQIADRPRPITDDIDDEELIDAYQAITRSFESHQAIIEESEVINPLPEPAPVEEQIEKVRRKQIKTLKVDQDKVDLLMDLVGELIVAKNSMQYLAYRAEAEFGVRKLAQDIKSEQTVISRLAEDLQSVVMQVRMVPLSTVFQRYPRLIRDISRKLDKQVDLIIEGEDTEADKSIVEDLSEPLVHLIRNSLDHGIEMPDVRASAGKNRTGKITLSAYTHDDSVVIKISDDGKGVDIEKVKAKALSQGLVDPNKLERMTDQEVVNLIFEAGFSTADQISDLSGRGVGMDSVRTAIERNGGTLTMTSVFGQGSEVTMILPLSMTISRVMMFEIERQSFAIPVESVIQTLKVNRNQDIRKVKSIDTFILRGETVPIIYLRDVFGMGQSERPEIQPVLVVRVGDEVIGLAVDRLQEGQDVIIKPLEGALGGFPVYRGAAIMGDGRVLLVLDTEEVVRHAY